MKQWGLIVALICVAFLLISPAAAYIANSSTVLDSYTDTQFANQNYLPYQYEVVFIAIAFVAWFGMRLWNDIEVLLGLVATTAFGVSAWFATYLCIAEVFTVVDMTDGGTTILYTQLVTPQPILQIILAVCTLFAFITTLYVIFLRDADKKMDATSVRSGR